MKTYRKLRKGRKMYTFPTFARADRPDNANVVYVMSIPWLATALRCFFCNMGCCMSNVDTGNSIVSYH